MSSLLKVLTLISILSSCVQFKGDLKVAKKITIYHEAPSGNLLKRVLPPNQYPAFLKILEDDSALLVFDALDGRTVATKMRLFDSSHLPKQSGSFLIPSEETSQDYDVKGTIKVMKKESDTFTGRERCYAYVDRYICRDYCDYYGCRPVCQWRTVKERGYRYVSYKDVVTLRRLVANLVTPNTDDVQASFKGKAQKKSRKYLSQSRCQL